MLLWPTLNSMALSTATSSNSNFLNHTDGDSPLIKPHGSETLNPLFVQDAQLQQQLLTEAESLPSLLLNSAAAANAVMLGAGYFNPLTG